MTHAAYQALTDWPRPVTQSRADSLFSAGLRDTKALLDKETNHIGARSVVIALDVRPEDIRKSDGEVKANRSMGPRVAVLIERKSKYIPGGRLVERPPLAFYCDRFRKWEDNLRAIALGLEALRRVDRYGITSGDEQYAGWTAIPQTSESRSVAFNLLTSMTGIVVREGSNPDEIRAVVKRALFVAHPDHGGTREDFERVQAARATLNA